MISLCITKKKTPRIFVLLASPPSCTFALSYHYTVSYSMRLYCVSSQYRVFYCTVPERRAEVLKLISFADKLLQDSCACQEDLSCPRVRHPAPVQKQGARPPLKGLAPRCHFRQEFVLGRQYISTFLPSKGLAMRNVLFYCTTAAGIIMHGMVNLQ